MVGIVVTGHGNFATGLESSLKLIYGGSSHIKFVDFVEGESTDTLKANLNAAFDELKEDGSILVLWGDLRLRWRWRVNLSVRIWGSRL